MSEQLDNNLSVLVEHVQPSLALSQRRILSANRLVEVLIGVGVTITLATLALARNIELWDCSSWWLLGAGLSLVTALALGFYARTVVGFTVLDLMVFTDQGTYLSLTTPQYKLAIIQQSMKRIMENEHALRKKYLLTQGMFGAYFLEAVLVTTWLLVR